MDPCEGIKNVICCLNLELRRSCRCYVSALRGHLRGEWKDEAVSSCLHVGGEPFLVRCRLGIFGDLRDLLPVWQREMPEMQRNPAFRFATIL